MENDINPIRRNCMHTHTQQRTLWSSLLVLALLSLSLFPGTPATPQVAQAQEPPPICEPPIEPVPTPADPTVITNCTQAALQTALADGGHITFDCGDDPVTITLNAPLVTSATEDIVLDGGGLITLDGNNSTRILEKPFTPGSQDDKTLGNDLTIQNMRFINGRAPAATKDRDGNARGGALWVTSPGTRLHIINSTFASNSTTSIQDEDNQGGAVYAANIYETVIVGSVFENNIAGGGGAFGGIATGLLVYNSRFTSNKADDDSSGGIVRGHGGALHLDGVTNDFNPDSRREVTICGSTFEDNTAVRGGGAIKVTVSDNKGTRAVYDRSTFRGNRLVGIPPTEGSGGAIYHIEDDRPTDENDPGGSNEDNIEISGSTFIGNYAYKQGGAVWLTVLGNGRIVNSTFYKNQASIAGSNRVGQGGAVIISGGIIDIINTTFVENFATFQGGAVFMGKESAEKIVTLTNTIFVDNELDPTHTNPVAPDYQGYHTNTPLRDGGQNIQHPRKRPVFNNDAKNNITDSPIYADPQLGTLTDNGGPTQTLAPQSGSPAIDAGASGCPATDQRGAPRVGVCDIGAVEFGAEPPPLAGSLELYYVFPTIAEQNSTQDVTISVYGAGFTTESVIQIDGVDRATTFVDSGKLTTTLSGTDLENLGTRSIQVYEPTAGTSGETTDSLAVTVLETINQVYMPLMMSARP
jgi:hypothetical protein